MTDESIQATSGMFTSNGYADGIWVSAYRLGTIVTLGVDGKVTLGAEYEGRLDDAGRDFWDAVRKQCGTATIAELRKGLEDAHRAIKTTHAALSILGENFAVNALAKAEAEARAVLARVPT